MFAFVRTFALCRLAAALVALALSGAPGVAAAVSRSAGRPCPCPMHARKLQCACCHQGGQAIGKARGQHGPVAARGESPAAPACACAASMEGKCGTPEARSSSQRVVEDFTLPDALANDAPESTGRVYIAISVPRDFARPPETPPPRHT